MCDDLQGLTVFRSTDSWASGSEAMEPTPFNDLRTIWFASVQKPHATSDYDLLFERNGNRLIEHSISKFPALWKPDEANHDVTDGEDKRCSIGQACNYLSPLRGGERVIGHYCIIKPFPPRLHEFLRELCEPYGQLVDAKVVKSKLDGSILGMADFKEQEAAQRAANAIDGSEIGDGTILSARYFQKRKRTKALEIIAERQSQLLATPERKKQAVVSPKMSDIEADLLADLCQQWACFSDKHDSMSLDALIWAMSSGNAFVKVATHKASLPDVQFQKDIAGALDELEKQRQGRRAVRELVFYDDVMI